MEKLIITAALTGNITLPTQTPYLPLTPQQIIDEAVRAANAGAASVAQVPAFFNTISIWKRHTRR
jgi:uncharacterized protein (DUF849 family)